MSRLKNFSRNLATSYLQLATTVVYSLLSVPIILHWLPRAEFGMWSLLVQLMTYISLVDVGINQAVARFLVDHKDRRESGEYGALVKISALVSVLQAAMVCLIVSLGSPLLARLMNIPAEHTATFVSLMRIQGVIAGFTFCVNPLMIMLNAHQRMDIVARQSILGMIVGLGVLIGFLSRGFGIYSFVYANIVTVLLAPIQYSWCCHHLGFFPKAGEASAVSWKRFKEVFLYGKDVFQMNVGIQLVSASQTIVVSRALGLEAAAAWTVGTKIFALIRQVMYQPTSAALPGLSEMLARQEHERLLYRFKNLVGLTASLGVFLGIAYALCNSLFVTIWTGGKITWSPLNDVLLSLWFFVGSVQTTHSSFVFVTKRIGWLAHVFILEGCVYVALALLIGYRWQMPGIIACSVLCLALFSCLFSLRQSSQYFHIPVKTFIGEWLLPSFKLALFLIPCAAALWLISAALPNYWRLGVHGVAISVVGGWLFFRVGLSAETRREAQSRLPSPLAKVLARLAPS